MKYFKNYSLLVLIMLLTFQYTNAQEKINQFNAKGERIGVWKKYYNNKRIRYEGEFNNGKEIGVFKYYSILSSKHPTIIKKFQNNSELASLSYYTVDGVLESEGTMEGKNRVGKWVYFYPEGEIMIEENYSNGALNGTYKSYYKTGKITEIINYKNGILHGSSKRYADNGNLLDDLNYEEGKLNGLANYYTVEGKIMYKGNYENDVKVGEWEFYDNGEKVTENKLKQ